MVTNYEIIGNSQKVGPANGEKGRKPEVKVRMFSSYPVLGDLILSSHKTFQGGRVIAFGTKSGWLISREFISFYGGGNLSCTKELTGN